MFKIIQIRESQELLDLKGQKWMKKPEPIMWLRCEDPSIWNPLTEENDLMAKMLLESDPDLCNQEGDVAKNDFVRFKDLALS